MSISQNFPNTRPSLNLNFARSQTLDPRITFTRTTSGTRVGPDGYIEVIPADQPRFDFDPVTGECLGFLVEEKRENFIANGSTVGNYGTKPTGLNYATTPVGQSVVVSSDFDIDGNGKSIKHTRGESGDNNVGYYTVTGLTTGVTHSFSVYVYIPSSQKDSITFIRFGPDSNSTNLEYGYADTNIVDRWQRVVGKYDPSTQISSIICRANASGGTYFYTDAWQLEKGAFPTSYIPTEGDTKKRNPDNVSMTGTNFTDWFNLSEGTILVDSLVEYDPKATKFVYGISGGSYDLSLRQPHLTGARFRAVIGGTFSSVPGTGNNAVNGSTTKAAVAYTSSTGRLQVGDSGVDVTPAGAVDGNQLGIGVHNGRIKQLTYYPTRLSNTQLQNLTK